MAGLVDLSLFAVSPTNDSHFAVSDPPSPPCLSSRSAYTENTLRAYAENALRQHDYQLPRSCTMKPLPPLPSRRLGGRRGGPLHQERDAQPTCILRRIRRPRPDDPPPPFDSRHTISQRRNIPPPPQLTLSVPQPAQRQRSHTAPSAMVWLPDEQIWLISDDAHPNVDSEIYEDSPPAYTREYSRSESPRASSLQYDLTPPLTPVQDQLRSLLEPSGHERLSSSALDRAPMQREMPRAPAMTDWSASYFPPSAEPEAMLQAEPTPLLQPEHPHPSIEIEQEFDWHNDAAFDIPSRATSFRSAVSAFDDDEPVAERKPSLPESSPCRWGSMARRVARPASTI